MKHTEKIVDGILVKYVCTPCPECKAKLEAAEEMGKALYKIAWEPLGCAEATPIEALDIAALIAKIALALWEKAGKGET